MAPKDSELDEQINTYLEKEYQRYVAWYSQNAKIAKNNLIGALVVVLICTICLVFFPNTMDQMSFLQFQFDPTNAIKLGLVASIVLAIVSMRTTLKRMNSCLTLQAQLEAEHSLFTERNETAFNAFKSNIDRIMAAVNPEVVTAVERDNLDKEEAN